MLLAAAVDQRADCALRPALGDRRLSGRRHGDRPIRAASVQHAGKRVAGRGARRRDAAVPDRARAGAVAAACDAARHFRIGRCAARDHGRRHRGTRDRDGPVSVARRAARRSRARDVRDVDRAAHPGRARTPAAALRPARICDPAVPGHGDRARCSRSCRCSRRPPERDPAIEPRRRREQRRTDRRRDRRRW